MHPDAEGSRPTGAAALNWGMAICAHGDAVVATMEVRRGAEPVMAIVALGFTENHPPRNVRLPVGSIAARRHHGRNTGEQASTLGHGCVFETASHDARDQFGVGGQDQTVGWRGCSTTGARTGGSNGNGVGVGRVGGAQAVAVSPCPCILQSERTVTAVPVGRRRDAVLSGRINGQE